jgi:two-component system response regulator YesN
MLSIMLVDDEILARTGLKLGINWAKVNMKVVAEAGSVSKALEVIRDNPAIDLVFTDIVMPGENGLDLLRQLKALNPNLPVVMMTYYNDFHYIQEALRLGAIDYIHKPEIEHASFYDILCRISNTITHRKFDSAASVATGEFIQALMVVGATEYAPPANLECECRYISKGRVLLLFKQPTDEQQRIDIEKQIEPQALLLFFDNIQGRSISDIERESELFINHEYFYRALPNLRIYKVSSDMPSATYDSEKLQWVDEQLKSVDWINSDGIFLKILSTIQGLRLSPHMVADLCFSVRMKWSHLILDDIDMPFVQHKSWYQWTDWLAGLRRVLSVQGGFSKYSPAVLASVQHVINHIDKNFTQKISVEEAAKLAMLSKSYFAKCFRDITHKTFHKYLNGVRLDHSVKLLESTHLSVARIAELSGFSDPFHFIKLFKKQYKVTPGQYRSERCS